MCGSMMEAETDPEVVTLAVDGSGFRAEARNVGGAQGKRILMSEELK